MIYTDIHMFYQRLYSFLFNISKVYLQVRKHVCSFYTILKHEKPVASKDLIQKMIIHIFI